MDLMMAQMLLSLYLILSFCSVIIVCQGPVANFPVSDCGVTKQCIGFPEPDCVKTGICTNLFKYTYDTSDPNHVKADLYGVPPVRGASMFWIAVGFNHQPNSMAGTLVTECVYNAGQIDVFASYNGDGYANQRHQQPKDGISGISGSLKDQILSCSFTLSRVRYANNLEFDLGIPLYVVMGQGAAVAWAINYHPTQPPVTANKIAVASVQPTKPFPNLQPLLTVSPVPAATPASTHDTIAMDASAPMGSRVTAGSSVDGCNERKGCHAYPRNCLASKTCLAIVSYAIDSSKIDQVQMELWRRMGQPGDQYVAAGFGPVSGSMAGSGAVSCVSFGSNVDVIASYNPSRYNVPVDNPRENITVTKAAVDGQSLYCQFTMPTKRSYNGRFTGSPVIIDISNQTFLMLAFGPAQQSGGLRQHTVMPDAVLVRLESVAVARSSELPLNLYKSHAGLMVGAWMFLASVGILTARHYKTMWTDYSPFGIKIWFHIHRPFMFLTVLASIAAFVIIYIRTGGLWTGTPLNENAHPVIGIIAFILALIQPIVAVFRPNPGAKNRPLFNWFHWAVGFASHIMAIAAIYLGLLMPQMSIFADYGYIPIWIMVAFSGFHALWLILLQIIDMIIPTLKKRQQTMQMKTINGNGQIYQETTKTSRSKPGSVLKTLMWVFHFIVVAGFTVAILVLIGISH